MNDDPDVAELFLIAGGLAVVLERCRDSWEPWDDEGAVTDLLERHDEVADRIGRRLLERR